MNDTFKVKVQEKLKQWLKEQCHNDEFCEKNLRVILYVFMVNVYIVGRTLWYKVRLLVIIVEYIPLMDLGLRCYLYKETSKLVLQIGRVWFNAELIKTSGNRKTTLAL